MSLLCLLFASFVSGTWQLDYRETEVVFTGLNPDTLAALRRNPPQQTFWRRVFPVYIGEFPEATESRPSILGGYHLEGALIVFKPRFPFYPGSIHNARFDLTQFYDKVDPQKTGPTLTLRFKVEERALESTAMVTQVFPSGSRLPANQLKFYIHFSQPMARGQAYRHIRLFEDGGEVVAGAFLEVDPELWDPETRRLTLFFDPGRIKRGLRPHKESGTPLRASRSYRLVVDADMEDARGARLRLAYSKSFTTAEADRRSPDFRDWELSPPQAGTVSPLILNFLEPMEEALARRMITIKDSSGMYIAGGISLHEGESVWHFTPDTAWLAGDYALHFEAAMEDLAGNHLDRLFDVEMNAQPAADPLPEELKRSFSIR